MKKIIICSTVFTGVIMAGFIFSFFISQNNAEKVRADMHKDVSELKGQLVLFLDGDFSPCWVFRGEYSHIMTGSTFDVYVSFMGNVLKVPEN